MIMVLLEMSLKLTGLELTSLGTKSATMFSCIIRGKSCADSKL